MTTALTPDNKLSCYCPACQEGRDAPHEYHLEQRKKGGVKPAELEEMALPWCKSLIAALKRLSFAAQTTGGVAGPDAELQAAIAQAEEAMSLRGLMKAVAHIEALEAELAACRVRAGLFNLAQRKGLLIIRTENVGISQNDPTTKVSWMEGHPKACDISNDAAMAAQEKA